MNKVFLRLLVFATFFLPAIAYAATTKFTDPHIVSLGLIAAALAVGLGSIGAGIAVAATGSAAIGALAEKPELLGKLLIVVGLAEGIAIYGLLIAIMVLGKF